MSVREWLNLGAPVGYHRVGTGTGKTAGCLTSLVFVFGLLGPAPGCGAAYADLPLVVTQTVNNVCTRAAGSIGIDMGTVDVGTYADRAVAIGVTCRKASTVLFSLSWSSSAGGTGTIESWVCRDIDGSDCCPLTGPCSEVVGPGQLADVYLHVRFHASGLGLVRSAGTLKMVVP